MNHILEIDSVILEFDTKRVLHNVYLKAETTKITGLLGRNGTGKSCLMNIIYGKLVPNDKSVRIDGKAMYYGIQNPENIMYLPQFSFIPKHLTIERIFKDFRLDFSVFIIQFPEFEKYLKTPFRNLSGGERRIIEIYVIISSKSKFCLLDEPFSHVMLVHVEKISNIIVKEKMNKGIIITDHLFRHIIDISDDIYLISNGKVHLTKSIQDIELLGYAKINN